ARHAVGEREDVRDRKRVRHVDVRETTNRRYAWPLHRRIVALEAREVRILLESAFDGRCRAHAERAEHVVAERGNDPGLDSVPFELRRDAANHVAERLLAIGLELHLDRDVHRTPLSAPAEGSLLLRIEPRDLREIPRVFAHWRARSVSGDTDSCGGST